MFARPHKFDQLGSAGRRLSRVPRYGRLIARLKTERFSRLKTESATFWEVYTQGPESMLASGLRPTHAHNLGVPQGGTAPDDEDFKQFQVSRACDLLGAIAFEMFSADGGPKFVESDTQGLKKAVVNRVFDSGAAEDFFGDPITKRDLFADLQALFAMDAHQLKYLIFSEHEREFRWTDITTQAFFAAFWASRWPTDLEMLRSWIPDPLELTNNVYLEFWRFVAEMPDEAICLDRWQALLEPLFDGSLRDENDEPIRSTELIYRTWDRMSQTAAGSRFLSEFSQHEHSDAARQLLGSQQESPFISLARGDQGPDDTGTFMMGAPNGEAPEWDNSGDEQNNPVHQVTLSPYFLHRHCVSNQQYELFDPRHRIRRFHTDKVDNTDQHPVVCVSWFDAWCFVTWVGQVQIGDRRNQLVPKIGNDDGWERIVAYLHSRLPSYVQRYGRAMVAL